MGANRCCVCDLRQGKDTHKSFFKVPRNEEERRVWMENLNIVRNLSATSFVCEDHFDPKDVRKFRPEVRGKNGEILIPRIPFEVIRLVKGARPLHINNSPMSSTVVSDNNISPSPTSHSIGENITELLSPVPITALISPVPITSLLPPVPSSNTTLDQICSARTELLLLYPKWNFHHDEELGIVILNSYVSIWKTPVLKEVIITSDLHATVKAVGHLIETFSKQLTTIEDFISFVGNIDRHNICCGHPVYKMFSNIYFKNASRDGNVMRHKKCPILIAIGEICLHCHGLERYLFRVVDNSMKPKKRTHSLSSAGSSKLTHKERKIQDLAKCHRELEKVKSEDLEENVKQFNLPANQPFYFVNVS